MQSLQKLALLQDALERIETDSSLDEKDVWLFDIRPEDLPQGKIIRNPQLNSDHVVELARELSGRMDREGAQFDCDGRFVTENEHELEAYDPEETPYDKISFAKIKEQLKELIQQEIKRADVLAEAERESLANWNEFVSQNYKPYLDSAVRIELNEDGTLNAVMLSPTRFMNHGWGNFLDASDAGSVSISPEAMAVLEKLPERDGLNGLEIYNGPNIQLTSGTEFALTLHPDHISVCSEGLKQLKSLSVIE